LTENRLNENEIHFQLDFSKYLYSLTFFDVFQVPVIVDEFHFCETVPSFSRR